jgi:hypothetical protein
MPYQSQAERGGPPTVDSLQQSSQGQASNIVERKQPQIDNACTAQSTGAAANLSQLDPQAPAASTTSSAGDPVADADTTCRWLQLGRTFRRSSLLPLTFDQGLSKLAAEAEGKQNARNKHKELRYLKDILREMADYFAEVGFCTNTVSCRSCHMHVTQLVPWSSQAHSLAPSLVKHQSTDGGPYCTPPFSQASAS